MVGKAGKRRAKRLLHLNFAANLEKIYHSFMAPVVNLWGQPICLAKATS